MRLLTFPYKDEIGNQICELLGPSFTGVSRSWRIYASTGSVVEQQVLNQMVRQLAEAGIAVHGSNLRWRKNKA